MSVAGQESVLHQAWNLLMDESATSIAILGPGGIGKTTLMKQLYSKLTSTKHFDTVIWITVSSKLTSQKIQDDISKCVGLFDADWPRKTSKEKSLLIRTEISEKKIVLFLDDLWFNLDLKSLGVEGSKFIYSTRFAVVPERMGAYIVFKLKELSEEDAWQLFICKVGDVILKDERIMEMARNLVSKCSGLPILISTLGRAMACRKTHQEWKSAVLKIQKYRQGKSYDKVTSIFKFCFDSLPNSKIRSCLLYFSLFPEDFTIPKNDLIDFWICENILSGYGIRGEALSWGYNVMQTLIGAGFLEEEENDCVKLLDMIRDFSVARVTKSQIFYYAQLLEQPAYDGPKLTDYKVIRKVGLFIAILFRFLKGGPLFVERKNEDSAQPVETIGWISSMGNPIVNNDLIQVPPALLAFLLNHNPFIMIKPKPLSSLYKLTVLDLSNSGIEVVPRDVSMLVSLQHLNLSHTWIESLPIELKMLTKLKCLNLEYDDQLRMIPKELISNLLSLRVLKMFRCGFSVEEVENNVLSLRNMDINPLLSLEHLKVLSITITCDSALLTFFNSNKLSNCTESLSLEVFWGSDSLDITPLAVMKNLLTLEIHYAEHLKEFNGHFPELLNNRCFERLQQVTIKKCSSLEELTWVVLVPNLTTLRVTSCEEIKEIISSRRMGEIFGAANVKPFAKLEILSLDSLPKLESVCRTALPFQCLRKMEIIECSLLRKLPLNTTLTKAYDIVILAEEDWWESVEWEDETAKTTFLPCFKPLL